jgi:hypothetical protein
LFFFAFAFLQLTLSAFSQSATLPEPIQSPPSNSNYYYKNFGQVMDHLGNVRYDVKYYTERTYPSMCLMEDKVAFCDFSIRDTSIVGALDTLRRIDMKFNCGKREGERLGQNMVEVCGALKHYEESADHLNYYLPHCGLSGITNVKGYARIVYEDVFPNINAHIYSNTKGPKVLFEVKPGANPNDIQLLFSGQDSIAVTSSGLAMYLDSWEMTLPQAYAYEVDASNNANMLSWLPVWNHSGGGNVNLFVGSYNTSNTLVIAVGDIPGTPLAIQNLDWSVYYGDDGEQRDSRIAADDKSVYHGMTQLALSFFATPGQQNNVDLLPNLGDWCISKFTNTKRDWSTYYGGTSRDNLTDIKTYDVKNNADIIGGIWVGGFTTSNNVLNGSVLPTGAFKQGFNAGSSSNNNRDGLLASFNKENGALKYNTYFGSSAEEFISRIAVDNENSILYIAGGTKSATTFVNNCQAQTTGGFPLCSGTGQYFKGAKSSAADSDGFIAQFNLKDMLLLWSTLFGGDEHEEITYLKTHKGKLYVGGVTYSKKLDQYPSPTTSHSVDRFPLAKKEGAFFQNSLSGSQPNNFISCFDNTKKLEWSTLLGQGFGVSGIEFNSKDELYALSVNISSFSNMFAPSSNVGNSSGLVPTYNNGIGYYETLMSDHQMAAILKFDNSFKMKWATKLHSAHSFGYSLNEPSQYRSGLTVDEKDRLFVFTSIDTVPNNTFTVNMAGAYWQANNSAAGITTPVGSVFDNFIYGFDNTDQLKWATFFGGVGSSFGSFDIAQGIVNQDKYIYVTGMTVCPNSPYDQCPYPNSYCDQTYNHGYDAFISRFDVSSLPTVGIKEKGINKLGIAAFPNPSANGIYNVNFVNEGKLSSGVEVNLQIVNQVGQVLANDKFKMKAGPNAFQLDLSQMAMGTYYLHLSVKGYEESVKLIKN